MEKLVLFLFLVSLWSSGYAQTNTEVQCPELLRTTIGQQIYLISQEAYTWSEARTICMQCARTHLADITNDVIYSSLNERPDSLWIGRYDGGALVDYLVWQWGPNPAITPYVPSNARRRFICDSNSFTTRCIYNLAGTLTGSEQNNLATQNSTSVCWTGGIMDTRGQEVVNGSITMCLTDFNETNLESPSFFDCVSTISVPSGSFTMLQQVTVAPLMNTNEVPSLFTHVLGGENENEAATQWGIQSDLGTGNFAGLNGEVMVLGLMNAGASETNEIQFDNLFVVDWNNQVSCY